VVLTTSEATTIAFDARYVNDRYHGIGRHAYNVLEALTRLDPGRRYLVYYHPFYPNHRFDLRTLGQRTNVELRPIRLPLFLPTEQLVWAAVLAKAGVTIFHSPYIALPLLARVRLVMTVHDLIFERFPEYMPRRWLRGFYRALMACSTRRAAAIFTVSETTRRHLEAYYRPAADKVHVIGNAVDAAFRCVEDSARLAAVRARYRLPERFVLTIGAGRPHKNVETLVDAFGCLDPSVAPALVIAGQHDPRFEDGVGTRVRTRRLEERVFRPGGIREADLPALYSLAEVFVFPSLAEGFGLPPLEAMACGTPVLASDAASISEVVGDAALRFPARDAGHLAAQLRLLLSNGALRADLSRRGLVRAQCFSWDDVARATLAAYAVVLRRG
jgi:glycosyltransferase involved in cell wall biosynthesis